MPIAALWRHLCLLHRLVHALDGYRAILSMLSPASAPGAVPLDHGLVPGELPGEYVDRCTRKRSVNHSIEDLWNEVTLILRHLSDGAYWK
jgi:hypothetical protein